VADPFAGAVQALARGELVVLPTDTVYGLAARPQLPEATARLFEAKGRSRDLTLPVLLADRDGAGLVGTLDDRARRLAERFWPGPLTLVLNERGTIGVRVPDHDRTRALLAETGPLAVTSANMSGEPTPPDCDGVRSVLGDAVAVYLCDDPRPPGPPSTVLDLTGPDPRVLREGGLDPQTVLATLR
jgi:L-threonylcarbamoyladenylate synthase